MPSAEASSSHRRRLREALRQLRGDARMTQERVATEMDWSLSKVIRVENGSVAISVNDVRGLLRLYGVPDDDRATQLVDLARTARQRPWWYAYREHFPAGFQTYLDLEAGTSTLKLHQTGCVPGLLRTERYARAVSQATAPEPVPPERLELELTVQAQRQRGVFGQEHPPQIVALLDEGCLRRTCGDRAALLAQLGYLLEVAQRPNVAIHVVPFAARVSAANVGSFVLLEFGADGGPPALYLDGLDSAQIVWTRQRIIGAYARLFDRVRSAALGAGDSITLIRRSAAEL